MPHRTDMALAAAHLSALYSDRSVPGAATSVRRQTLYDHLSYMPTCSCRSCVPAVQGSSRSSAVWMFAACSPQLHKVALQPLAQQPAATTGTCSPARMLLCRLDAYAAAIRVSSQPLLATQQQPVSCSTAAAAWLSGDVGLAAAPAAGAGAAAAGGTRTCSSM